MKSTHSLASLAILVLFVSGGCQERRLAMAPAAALPAAGGAAQTAAQSSTPQLDAIYLDSDDNQNQIVILDGDYYLEHEHLTESGKISTGDAEGIYTFTIESGDTVGRPPYAVKIDKQGDQKAVFTVDGEPLLNKSGVYIKGTDREELQRYAK